MRRAQSDDPPPQLEPQLLALHDDPPSAEQLLALQSCKIGVLLV